jgi:hypothetical protein|tara:strand:- start:9 stop:257 length:249 start_codon:yes stop_codon:yes gene_type:complete
MEQVYIIEENVDYEGDSLVSIHATLQGALCVLDRKHAELAKLGTIGLEDIQLEQDKNGVRVKSAYFRFRDRGFYMSAKEVKE